MVSGRGSSLSVCTPVGKDNIRPLGTGGSKFRSFFRIFSNTSRNRRKSFFYAGLAVKARFPFAGARFLNAKRSNRGNSSYTSKRRNLFSSVSSPQKDGKVEANFESQGPKLKINKEKVQNGNFEISNCKCQKVRLVNRYRPQGCVFPCSDKRVSQKIPQVCVSEQEIPIQGNAVWPISCSKSFHQNSCSNCRVFARQRDQNISLHRRYSDNGGEPPISRKPEEYGNPAFSVPGLDHQPGQVPVNPITIDGIHWGTSQNRIGSSSTSKGACAGSDLISFENKEPSMGNGEKVPGNAGFDGINNFCGRKFSFIHAATSTVLTGPLEAIDSPIRSLHSNQETLERAFKVVVSVHQSYQGNSLPTAATTSHPNNRCISDRVGSGIERSESIRHLEDRAKGSPYKCIRNVSGSKCDQTLDHNFNQQSDSSRDRQYNSGIIYKETGRNSLPGPLFSILGASKLLYRPQHYVASCTCARKAEFRSRRPQSDQSRFDRVGNILKSNSESVPGLAETRDRPVCHKQKQKTGPVLFQGPIRGNISSGQPPDELEQPVGLCLSSSELCPISSSKGSIRQNSFVNPNSSSMEKEVLVSFAPSPPHRFSDSIASNTDNNSVKSKNFKHPISCLEIERERWRNQGISQEIADTIIASRRQSTRSVYDSQWRQFHSWCLERKVNPVSATIPIVLEFLHEKREKGCSSNTLAVSVAAISAFHNNVDGVPISKSLAISRYIKGVKLLNPQKLSLAPPWCLGSVLTILAKSPFEPMANCDLKLLTMKTVFLLAVCSARRVSELQALSCSPPFTIVHGGKASLRTVSEFLPKCASDWHRRQSIELPSFYHIHNTTVVERNFHNMCPVRALKFYIDRTKELRKSDQLFVLHSPPKRGFPASKSTISRWIVDLIRHAYAVLGKSFPSVPHAHQTRAVATSWADFAKCNIQEITRAAMWSSSSTFVKHYKIDIFHDHENSLSHKVLSSATEHVNRE